MNQVSRRRFLALSSSLFAVPLALAQSQAKIHRLGFLGMPSASGWTAMIEALRTGLREHGYVEGRNLIIEFRWADGKYDKLPELAADLLRANVEVIITHATPGVRAAMQATTAIPIVIAAAGDVVDAGLVASLARPGGNVTGSSFLGPQISAKRVSVLKEALPQTKRIGLIFNREIGTRLSIDAVVRAAGQLNIAVVETGVLNANEFSRAFTEMATARVDAVLINEDPMLVSRSSDIADLARKHKLPTVGYAQIAESGGLIAYGASLRAMHRRAAYFVDKILKGAKPADLPIEQPQEFELIVNLKTAKSLGVRIPNSVLARADRLIE